MNIQNKRALVVCVILAMGLGILTVSHGMKRLREEPEQPQYKSEFFGPLEYVSDVKEGIERAAVYFMLKDAVEYLNSGKPIKLEDRQERDAYYGETALKVAANKLFVSLPNLELDNVEIKIWDIFSKEEQKGLAKKVASEDMEIGIIAGDKVVGLVEGIMWIWNTHTSEPLHTFELGWSKSLKKIDLWTAISTNPSILDATSIRPVEYKSFGHQLTTYGNKAAVADWNLNLACILDMSTDIPKPLHILDHQGDDLLAVVMDSNKVITATWKATDKVKIWDINTGKLLREFTPGDGVILDVSNS